MQRPSKGQLTLFGTLFLWLTSALPGWAADRLQPGPAQRIGARHTVFIHMTHELEYHALNARLPHGMEVAYDGMRLISA